MIASMDGEMTKMKGTFQVHAADPAACPNIGQSNTDLMGAAIAAAGAAKDCRCTMRITTPSGRTWDVQPGESYDAVATRLREIEGEAET